MASKGGQNGTPGLQNGPLAARKKSESGTGSSLGASGSEKVVKKTSFWMFFWIFLFGNSLGNLLEFFLDIVLGFVFIIICN